MKVGLRRLVAIMIAFALVLSYIPKSGLTLYNVHAEDSTITIANSDFSSDIWGDSRGWSVSYESTESYPELNTFEYSSDSWMTPPDGSEYGAKFYSTSANSLYFTQTIDIPAGSYEFESVNMGENASISISVNDNDSDSITLSGYNIWDNTSLYFSTDEDISNATLKITVNISAGGWGYLDSITAKSIDKQEYNNATTTEDTAINNAEITVKKVDNLSDDFALGTDISAIHSIYESGAYCKDYNGNRLSEAQWDDIQQIYGMGYGGQFSKTANSGTNMS